MILMVSTRGHLLFPTMGRQVLAVARSLDDYLVSGIGETIKLKRGDHVLEIQRGDVVVKTQDFKVVRGDETPLRISLLDQEVANPDAVGGTDTSGSGGGEAGRRAPAIAVAPFDAAQAKQHQEAWADYLGVPVEATNSIGMNRMARPAVSVAAATGY